LATIADGHDHPHGDEVHADHAGKSDEHAGHGPDHTGHEEMFRKRFWISSALSIPVLFWSGAIQNWFGYTAPEFTGSFLIVPVLATFIFVYGGFPFLSMAGFELRKQRPGMMTLISLAISVAYGFSMLTIVVPSIGDDFFWELVTLIDIMLLGHWMEMRSVRQASGALGALAKLMPDTAEIDGPDGVVTTIPVSELTEEQIMLIRPGASVPADGVVDLSDSWFPMFNATWIAALLYRWRPRPEVTA
jgi:Cu2+-exporting ATPase